MDYFVFFARNTDYIVRSSVGHFRPSQWKAWRAHMDPMTLIVCNIGTISDHFTDTGQL